MNLSGLKTAAKELFSFSEEPKVKKDRKDRTNVRIEPQVSKGVSPEGSSNVGVYARSANYNTELSAGGFPRSSQFVLELGPNDFKRSSAYTFDASNTWWKKVPKIVSAFFKIMFAPVFLVRYVLDLALSAIVFVVLGSILLWSFNIIPDQQVIEYLTGLGDRLLFILEGLGLSI